MMINKRLIHSVKNSQKYVIKNVLCQWISLLANIVMMIAITSMLGKFYQQTATTKTMQVTMVVILMAIIVRAIMSILASKMSYLSSKSVKKTLRHRIYQKLLNLGVSYQKQVKTSEIVQVAVEGVDQLETYFGAYLPQFFYAMLAPLTLFIVLAFINLKAAIILLICVPLIPVTIIVIQKIAKRLLNKYWGQYTALGDTFLENLQGLTTLKVYQADEYKNQQMNIESEKFRKITMKVLTMQLNSITVMDIIAYGGAALGVIISILELQTGKITLSEALLIILLSADFFIPMRQLGSFFHIAMNGMAASDKIFRLLDLKEKEPKIKHMPLGKDIKLSHVHFSYEKDRQILKDISIKVKNGQMTALVGESGSGKSTIASLLMARQQANNGEISVGETLLSEINEEDLMKNMTYVSHQSYLFKGTIRENLEMAKLNASDEEMWKVLEKAHCLDFITSLDEIVLEKGSNYSGGQCQRLAFARALLHNSNYYIFDEATSNIDVESENQIMEGIYELSKTKTVLMITHRLANVKNADMIYVLDNGKLVEQGRHQELITNANVYAKLWKVQSDLESYGKEVKEDE